MTGMTAVTCFGMTADPEELRVLAAAVDAGAGDWHARVDALPVYVLDGKTLASPPDVIAGRLREVAAFLERRRDGVPFGGHEFAAQATAARERMKDMPRSRTRRRHG